MFLRSTDTSVSSLVKRDKPGLGGSDKVDNLHLFAKVLVGGEVGVGGCGNHVVNEREVIGDILGCPVREECVQQTLISPVK